MSLGSNVYYTLASVWCSECEVSVTEIPTMKAKYYSRNKAQNS